MLIRSGSIWFTYPIVDWIYEESIKFWPAKEVQLANEIVYCNFKRENNKIKKK